MDVFKISSRHVELCE